MTWVDDNLVESSPFIDAAATAAVDDKILPPPPPPPPCSALIKWWLTDVDDIGDKMSFVNLDDFICLTFTWRKKKLN